MRPRGFPSTAMSKYVLCVTFLGSAALCVGCGIMRGQGPVSQIDPQSVDEQKRRLPDWTHRWVGAGPIDHSFIGRPCIHPPKPHTRCSSGDLDPSPPITHTTHNPTAPLQSLAHLATEARTARRPKTRLLVIMVAVGWSVVWGGGGSSLWSLCGFGERRGGVGVRTIRSVDTRVAQPRPGKEAADRPGGRAN